MDQERILCGWKAIEAYTGLTRKTILSRGYPVRKSGGVYAFQDELDAARRMARRLAPPAGAARHAAGAAGTPGPSGRALETFFRLLPIFTNYFNKLQTLSITERVYWGCKQGVVHEHCR